MTFIVSLQPDSKVHVANMGPTWVLVAPGTPHFVPMDLAIRVLLLVKRGIPDPRVYLFSKRTNLNYKSVDTDLAQESKSIHKIYISFSQYNPA